MKAISKKVFANAVRFLARSDGTAKLLFHLQDMDI